MDNILNNALVWFIIGFGFFLLEFIVPGFILFFFGVGAWVVSLLTFFFDFSLNIQIITFIVSSLITVVLFRNWIRKKFGMDAACPQILEDEFIGKTARVAIAIAPGSNGKVEFKGTLWDAASEDTIAAGETATITETRSILLIVKSNQIL